MELARETLEEIADGELGGGLDRFHVYLVKMLVNRLFWRVRLQLGMIYIPEQLSWSIPR